VVIELGFSEGGKRERGQNQQDAERLKFTKGHACSDSVLGIIHNL
jgi:hypothetical protein